VNLNLRIKGGSTDLSNASDQAQRTASAYLLEEDFYLRIEEDRVKKTPYRE